MIKLTSVGNYPKDTPWYITILDYCKKDKVFKPVKGFGTCRGYIGEGLLYNKNPRKEHDNPWNTKNYNYKTGDVYVALTLNESNLNKLKSNIKWLNNRESKSGLKKSTIVKTNVDNVYVVKGSKFWKDSAWKIMLYTFYIKCCCIYNNPEEAKDYSENMYWDVLKKNDNEKKLLSKLKIKREIFDEKVFSKQNPWDNRAGAHDKEGFVSICQGKNPPMAKLLGLTV